MDIKKYDCTDVIIFDDKGKPELPRQVSDSKKVNGYIYKDVKKYDCTDVMILDENGKPV